MGILYRIGEVRPVSPEEKQQGEALISQAIADGAIR